MTQRCHWACVWACVFSTDEEIVRAGAQTQEEQRQTPDAGKDLNHVQKMQKRQIKKVMLFSSNINKKTNSKMAQQNKKP